jgi:O-antigen ligase
MRWDWPRARGAAWLLGGVALTIGFLLPVLPEPAQLGMGLVVALPVITVVIRSLVRFGRLSRGGFVAGDDGGSALVASDDRLARWLTYLGFGTLALLTLRPTSALTVSDWVFLSALVVMVLGYRYESRGIRIAPPRLVLAGVALVVIGALLSLEDSVDGGESLAVVARFVYLTLGWFALAGYALRTTRDVSVATQLWVASVGLSGAAAVAQLFGGPDIIPGTAAVLGRMTGFTQNVTDLGGMCAIALAPAISLLDSPGRGPVRRIASVVLVGLVAAGLILSGSVDGLIAAAVALAIWIWTGSPGRRGVGALLGLAALFVVIAGTTVLEGLVLPGARIASVFSGASDPNATFYARLQTYEQALSWIGGSPVFGAGFDTASASHSGVGLVHNLLIASWFEGGIFGFVGIVVVLLGTAVTAWRAWTGSRSPESRRLAASLLAAVGAAIAFSMGNPILFQRYIWAPAFLVIALVSHETRTRVSAAHIPAGAVHGSCRTTKSIRSST